MASGLWLPEGGAESTSQETGLLKKEGKGEESDEEIYEKVEDTVD